MRPLHLILLGVLAAALALGAWAFLGGLDAPALDGPSTVNAGLRPGTEESVDERPRSVDRARESAGTAREGLALAPPETATDEPLADEGDTARLVGRVVDPEGAPVSGARVHAVVGASWIRLPLDAELDGLSDWFERHDTVSGSDGRFAYEDDLDEGELRIAVRAAGFAPLYAENLRLSERRPHDVGELRLARGVRLAGRVVDRRGTGIAGATILQAIERGVAGMRVSMPGRGIPLAETGAEGEFVVDSLAHGPWTLIVDAPGYQAREERGRTEAAGEEREGLVFQLEPGETIRGAVRSLPPELLGRARVEARVKQQNGNRGGEPEEAEQPLRRVRRAPIVEGAAFTLGGLAPAVEHVLTVWEEGEDGRWKRVEAVGSTDAYPGSRVELVYEPESVLTIHVVDAASGEPVTDYVLWAGVGNRLNALDAPGEDDEVLRSHPGGRARYEGLRPGRDGGRARVRVRAPGYKDWEREDVVLPSGREVDLGTVALERAPVLALTVLDDASGEPVEGAHAFLAPEGEDALEWYTRSHGSEAWGHRSVRFAVTDSEGRARLPAPLGERCMLVVTSEDHVPSEPEDVLVRVGGDLDRTVRLDVGGSVVVTVRTPDGEPLEGARVQHKREEPAQQQDERQNQIWGMEDGQPTDPEGVVRFDHLALGTHLFRLQAEQGQMIFFNGGEPKTEDDWSRVRVARGAEEELALVGKARGRVFGRVTEARLPLAGATLNLRAADGGDGGQIWFGGSDAYTALSAHDGTYELANIDAGEYVLTVTHAERRMPFETEVTVTAEGTPLDVELPLAIVEGRVTDEGGRPLAGLRIDVATTERRRRGRSYWAGGAMTLVEDDQGGVRPDWRSSRVPPVETDAQGRYALRGVASGTPLRVSANGPFVQPDSIDGLELAPDEIRSGVDLTLALAGRIEVAVGGERRGQVMVEATLEAEGEGGRQRKSTRIWGSRPARLDSCRPGEWKVTVKVREGEEWKVAGEDTVEVRANETARVTVEVP